MVGHKLCKPILILNNKYRVFESSTKYRVKVKHKHTRAYISPCNEKFVELDETMNAN